MPAVNGASGPTTVISIELSIVKFKRAFISFDSIFTHSAISDMPPFPGAQ